MNNNKIRRKNKRGKKRMKTYFILKYVYCFTYITYIILPIPFTDKQLNNLLLFQNKINYLKSTIVHLSFQET